MTATPSPPAGASGPTVLVVEDSQIDRFLVEAVIERQLGWTAEYVGSGTEALEALARRLPQIVLTDLQLPELDGLQVVEAVRERYPDVPVVLMTSHGNEATALRALQAGAASYVPKSAIAGELADTLERVQLAAIEAARRRQLRDGLERTSLVYRLDNDPALVPPLVAVVRDIVMGLGLCPENSAMRFGVAVEESLLNAMIHGNLEVSSSLRQEGDEKPYRDEIERRRTKKPYCQRRVRVAVAANRKECRVTVRDQGQGFDVSSLPDPTDPENLMRIGGRGILLMRTFTDDLRFNDRGTEAVLIKRYQPAPVAHE